MFNIKFGEMLSFIQILRATLRVGSHLASESHILASKYSATLALASMIPTSRYVIHTSLKAGE